MARQTAEVFGRGLGSDCACKCRGAGACHYLSTCLYLLGTSALLQGKVLEYKDGVHLILFTDGQEEVS